MINCNRINESVMAEMRRQGVGAKKPLVESAMSDKDLDRQEKAIKAKADKKVKKPVKEDDEAKEVGTEDKQFDAPTGKEIDGIDKKPEGIDTTHDEGEEEKDDPTREKLETAKDEADEKKGGPAELAADLRVSVRIEKMGLGRYRRMLAKHELSQDDEKWLKERISDLEGCIKSMEDKLPELEKEVNSGEIKESMKNGLRKAIVEMMTGQSVAEADERDDLKCVDNCGKKCDPTSSIKVRSFYDGKWNKGYRCKDCERDRKQDDERENAQASLD